MNRREKKIWAMLVLAPILCILGTGLYREFFPRDVALREAAADGEILRARILLLIGANPNAGDENGSSALHYAAGHTRPQMVKLLLSAGADPNLVDKRGEAPLCDSLDSGNRDSLEVDNLLISAGGLSKVDDPFAWIGNSHTAVAHIEILVSRGADINKRDNEGFEPLMSFARDGGMDGVRSMVLHGSDINAVGPNGYTALVAAIKQPNPDMVEFLLRHGANKSIRYEGKILVDYAEDLRKQWLANSFPNTAAELEKIIQLLKS